MWLRERCPAREGGHCHRPSGVHSWAARLPQAAIPVHRTFKDAASAAAAKAAKGTQQLLWTVPLPACTDADVACPSASLASSSAAQTGTAAYARSREQLGMRGSQSACSSSSSSSMAHATRWRSHLGARLGGSSLLRSCTARAKRSTGLSEQQRASRLVTNVLPAPAPYQYYDADRFTVLITEELGQSGVDLLAQYADIELAYGLTEEQLEERVQEADALIVMNATQVTRRIFEASGGRLKVVGKGGVGIENIDLAAATEHGCLVVNAPTANTVAAAEHSIALLCSMARNIPAANAAVKAGKWDQRGFVGTSLAGKTLAVFGFGKVGSEVCRRGKGLGMNVIAYDPYASAEKASAMGVTLVPFEAALQLGDFLSLHMPLSPSTRNLINEQAFEKMKRGARIVNVARGGVIQESALLEALNSGQVAQAALDVFSLEPPETPECQALVQHPSVICTPHLGASTTEALEGVAIEVVEAVVEALMGKLSPNAVNAPMVPAEVQAELQPYISLAEGLGRVAVSLVAETGFKDINITYSSPRGDDLDTRLLRAMVVKGVLEAFTTARVNLVNADLLARTRGIRITEVTVRSDGSQILGTLSVSLGTSNSKFSASVDRSGRIYVEGQVRNASPFITKIGNFDVELSVLGSVLLTRQVDRPGIVARVSSALAEDTPPVNISFMTVGRIGLGGEALMAIGIDQEPSAATLEAISRMDGIVEATVFKELVDSSW